VKEGASGKEREKEKEGAGEEGRRGGWRSERLSKT